MTKQRISAIKIFLHNYILFHIGLFNAYLTFCCLNQDLHSLASVSLYQYSYNINCYIAWAWLRAVAVQLQSGTGLLLMLRRFKPSKGCLCPALLPLQV